MNNELAKENLSETIKEFTSLPKVELHLHLDCSLSFDIVNRINPSISFERYQKEYVVPVNCADLDEYLEFAVKGTTLMQKKSHLRLVTLDLCRQLSEDNNLYTEIRFAPIEHTREGLKPEEVVRIVNEAVNDGMAIYGIYVKIILCTLRHYSKDQSLLTIKLVENFLGTNVVGFDIASDEVGFPIDAHIEAFEYAFHNNIPCTAHAGEAKGAESVQETIDVFKPSRIGHGVRCIENPSVVDLIKKKNIHLEICPTSNLRTKVVTDMKKHPIDDLYRKGISLSINTDARSILGISLSSEYAILESNFNWLKKDFLQTNLLAIEHAFASKELKEKVMDKLRNAYE